MNVGLKLDVLFVAGIYETLTGGGEHKCRHLVKMWMGTAMRGLVRWDNHGPRAEDALGYFHKAVLFLRAHREEVTGERLKKHRELYGVILEKQLRGVKCQVSRGGGVMWHVMCIKGLPNSVRRELVVCAGQAAGEGETSSGRDLSVRCSGGGQTGCCLFLHGIRQWIGTWVSGGRE